MEIYKQLPKEIQAKVFLYSCHPVAEIFKKSVHIVYTKPTYFPGMDKWAPGCTCMHYGGWEDGAWEDGIYVSDRDHDEFDEMMKRKQ